MTRRESLSFLGLGLLGGIAVLAGCAKTDDPDEDEADLASQEEGADEEALAQPTGGGG